MSATYQTTEGKIWSYNKLWNDVILIVFFSSFEVRKRCSKKKKKRKQTGMDLILPYLVYGVISVLWLITRLKGTYLISKICGSI